jgi:DNA-binding CsgD family transcriptional regulator
MTGPKRRRPIPKDFAALESEDGDVILLSFELPQGPTASLTPAESEVARLLLAGKSNAEIAVLRGCSPRTVANQVARIYRKMGVSSRLELVAFASLLAPPRRERGPKRATDRDKRKTKPKLR